MGKWSDGQDLDEQFDVLDEPTRVEDWRRQVGIIDPASVRRTGSTMRRGDIHRQGIWHRSIHLWIVTPSSAGPSILMQKRAATKDTHPGLWDVSVAGHIDAGDKPLDTAVREAEEELGVQVTADELQCLYTVAAEVKGSTKRHGAFICREVQDIFLYELAGDAVDELRFSTGEVEDLRAEPMGALLQRLRDRDAAYVPRSEEYISALSSALARRYPLGEE